MTDDDFTPVSAPSRDGWPDRYFAVIFTAQRTLSDEDMYSLTAERMVELVQQYGPRQIIVDSSADWGVSDPLSVPKTAALMLERGVDPEAVRLTTWQNALDAYAQSGQIDVEALESTLEVDQRQLFSDNSVLRGQEPRVDGAVPN